MKAQKETLTIDLQNFRGQYMTITKTFNGNRHFHNWVNVIGKKGIKVIGIH